MDGNRKTAEKTAWNKEIYMDNNVIKECTRLSLSEEITFPQVVMKLAQAGVERYIFDMVGRSKLTYGNNDEYFAEEIDFPAIKIAEVFDSKAVKQAITDIQQGRIKYKVFLQNIMQAGCSHYEVFISGRKAIYFGKNGNHHIEIFPGK